MGGQKGRWNFFITHWTGKGGWSEGRYIFINVELDRMGGRKGRYDVA